VAERTDLTIDRQRRTAADGLSPPHPPVRSLYIHVPFCFHKCHYCDFYSFVDTQDRQAPFVEALELELGALAPHAQGLPLRTIFIGGGTPSLLRVDLWERLLATLAAGFDLTDPALEFTVECNPETVTPELMRTLRAGGVNRVSIGAQSFDRSNLATLERWHEPASVERAIRLAADAGIERRSIDLIFAVPGQTADGWRRDLASALEVADRAGGIDHISCYALTYEPNTAMTARLRKGEFAAVDEDTEADMYLATVEMLRDAGLERYEVSNFARPGSECRHNLAYWRQEQWLAAGPSASAHVGGRRWKSVPRLTDWMRAVEDSRGFAPVIDFEDADPARALIERLMTGLRLSEGIDAADARRHAAEVGAEGALDRAVATAAARGHLTESSGRWRLTEPAWLLADGIASDLMRAVAQGASENKHARHGGPGED